MTTLWRDAKKTMNFTISAMCSREGSSDAVEKKRVGVAGAARFTCANKTSDCGGVDEDEWNHQEHTPGFHCMP